MSGIFQEHEAYPSRSFLLVELDRFDHRCGVHRRIELDRKPVPQVPFADLLPQVIGPGEAQRGQQPERDRLTVPVALVCGDRLDRVTDRVTEVELGAQSGVPFVRRDDRALVAGAGEDQVGPGQDLSGLEATNLVPEAATGQQSGLDDLGHARRSSSASGRLASVSTSLITADGR